MASKKSRPSNRFNLRAWITPRHLRSWREYLTGYLMIAPSVLLIFIFGIFPVGFALYVSLHKWRLKRDEIIGLDNYVNAIGGLAYLMFFALGIIILILAYLQLRKAYHKNPGQSFKFFILNIPGILLAAAILSFIHWAVVLLPHILDIANKITGVEKTRTLFMQLLGESFNSPDVLQARSLMLWLIAAGLLVFILCVYLIHIKNNLQIQGLLAVIWTGVGAGALILYYVYSEMMADYDSAVLAGTGPGFFPQLVSIASGLILLFIGYKIWQTAKDQHSTWMFTLRLLAAMVFVVGGWIMVGELPVVVAAGDPDLWVGLRATLFYALGTVPFQLGISLFLAVLLFQNLTGSSFFRILYFLPYVTPTVASAAVFRQIFSNRYQTPVNSGLRLLGLDPLQWLWEPKGILQMMATSLGIENWPAWANGPSLALVVIMIYSIWTFVGYDTVIYLAGLGNIPKETAEAAEVDGANRWQVFRHITFPLLSPSTYFLTIISVIGTFKAFNHIWVMRLEAALQTTDTFSVVIFSEFYEKLRYGYASAMAFILFGIILILTFLNTKIQGSKVFYG
jgi:multiple sugar transport system permease protein